MYTQLDARATTCNLDAITNVVARIAKIHNGKRLAPAEKPAAGTKSKGEPHTYQKQSLKRIKTMKFMN